MIGKSHVAFFPNDEFFMVMNPMVQSVKNQQKQQEIQEHWEQKCYTPLKDYQPPADPSIITLKVGYFLVT